MRLVAAAVGLVALVAVAPAASIDRDHWINATSISRLELGDGPPALRILFGRTSTSRGPGGLSRVRAGARHIEAFFRHGRAVAVLTWDPHDATLDHIGPCSSARAFRKAYRGAPAVRAGGALVGYRLGRLVFTLTPDRTRVANVALLAPSVGAGLGRGEPPCRLPP